jgi:hypothetical protein
MVRHLAFGSFVAMLVSATSAAAVQRTFVRSDGVDSNPCTLQKPCRGFAAAIALTDPDGEIIVLDSAGYGSLTVTKAVSIIAPPGVYAGISVFAAQDGVTVNAGASDKVSLRGLAIKGQGGNRGIVVIAAGEVHIEQCTIADMATHGIEIDGGTRIHVRSSAIRSNGQHGLFVAAGSPELNLVDSQVSRNGQNGIHVAVGKLDATRTTVDNNAQDGVRVEVKTPVNVTATLTDSTFTGNGGEGTIAGPAPLQTVAMAIARSTSARNGKSGFVVLSVFGWALLTVSDSFALENAESGLYALGSHATAIVAGSTLSGNSLADLAQSSEAVLRSSGNTLTGRGAADIQGTITPNPPQ